MRHSAPSALPPRVLLRPLDGLSRTLVDCPRPALPPPLLAPLAEVPEIDAPVAEAVVPEIEWAECPHGLRGVACNACWNDTACVDVTGRAGVALPQAPAGTNSQQDRRTPAPPCAEPRQGPTRPGATTQPCSTPRPPRRATRAQPRWADQSACEQRAGSAITAQVAPSLASGWGRCPASLRNAAASGCRPSLTLHLLPTPWCRHDRAPSTTPR